MPPWAHTSSIVAAGSETTVSAGRPSPSWQSTLSVPMTPLASFAHAYAASLVRRAPPSTPMAPGSAFESASPAAAKASDHDAPISSSRLRTSGSSSRSSCSIASKENRPLSHSQPQLTGSMSTPW